MHFEDDLIRLLAVVVFALALLPVLPAAAAAPTPSPNPCTLDEASPTTAAPPPPTPTPVSSPDARAALCQQERLLAEVKAQLGSHLADALSTQAYLRQALEQNAQQQQSIQAQVDEAELRLAALDAELARLDDDLAAAARRLNADQEEADALARTLYTRPHSAIVILVASRDLEQAMLRIAALTSAGNRAEQLRDDVAAMRDRIGRDRAQAGAARSEAERRRAELAVGLARLRDLADQERESAGQLAGEIAETRAELAQVDNQSSALAQKVEALLRQRQELTIAAAYAAAWQQASVWLQLAPVGTATRSPGHSIKYRFVWPEPTAVISQPFGPSNLDLEPPFAGLPHFHTGIDLAAPQGTPVLAADDGVVAVVGAGNVGYGKFVILAHQGGFLTLYGHLDQAVVKVGDEVVQGQPIGLEGSTGNSTGPHLHFEVREADQPIDPALLLPPGQPSTFSA